MRGALLWILLACVLPADDALTAAKPAKAARPAARPQKRPASLPEASPEQLAAAEQVFHGRYDCEFGQSIDIAPDPAHPGYAVVKFGKAVYAMKPVLSTTGAVRLEDVKGVMLVVQIASKSMLMDVKAGRRLVDECIGARQRELGEAAARVKAAEAAASAASAASAIASGEAGAASDAASSAR